MPRVFLLFPIAVVTLAFATFAFGGHCALWQWWLAAVFAGRRSFLPLVLMVVLGIGAAPLPMMGYIRYVPWWLLPVLFLYIDLVCRGDRGRKSLACLVALDAKASSRKGEGG